MLMSWTAHIRFSYSFLALPRMMLTQSRIRDLHNNHVFLVIAWIGLVQ